MPSQPGYVGQGWLRVLRLNPCCCLTCHNSLFPRRQAIAADPRNPLAKFERATVLMAEERYRDALAELHALKVGWVPWMCYPWKPLAKAYFRWGMGCTGFSAASHLCQLLSLTPPDVPNPPLHPFWPGHCAARGQRAVPHGQDLQEAGHAGEPAACLQVYGHTETNPWRMPAHLRRSPQPTSHQSPHPRRSEHLTPPPACRTRPWPALPTRWTCSRPPRTPTSSRVQLRSCARPTTTRRRRSEGLPRSCAHHTARLPVAASALLDLSPRAAPRAAAQSPVGSWMEPAGGQARLAGHTTPLLDMTCCLTVPSAAAAPSTLCTTRLAAPQFSNST